VTINYPVVALPAASGSSCAATSYPDAVSSFPVSRRVALEPFKGGGLTVLKPSGWASVPGLERRILFRPTAPDPSGLTELGLLFLDNAGGKIRDQLGQAAAGAGLTIMGAIEDRGDHAAAVASSRADGTEKVVRMLARITGATTIVAQLAAPTLQTLKESDAEFLLREIVSTLQPTSDVTGADIVGEWHSSETTVGVDYVNPSSPMWVGQSATGEFLVLRLTADGQYNLFQAASAVCSGLPPCAVEGTVAYWAAGRYVFDGGLLAFDRKLCTSSWYNRNNIRESTRVCLPETSSAGIFVERGEGGALLFSGVDLTPHFKPQFQKVRARRR
jgi:hypothetical protein